MYVYHSDGYRAYRSHSAGQFYAQSPVFAKILASLYFRCLASFILLLFREKKEAMSGVTSCHIVLIDGSGTQTIGQWTQAEVYN